MYPAFGWSRVAPGHHGCKRAFDLIRRQASSGVSGSPVLDRAGKTLDELSRIEIEFRSGRGGYDMVVAFAFSRRLRCEELLGQVLPSAITKGFTA
jgi:hypothetical protein